VTIDLTLLPSTPALLRVRSPGGPPALALWRDGLLLDLSAAGDARLRSLDTLLGQPMAELRPLIEAITPDAAPILDGNTLELLAPVESQEVWAAGVTYSRSREARMEEAAAKDIYAQVYEAERPELFFKAAGWRVVPPGGDVGIRSDSDWDVPEPELAVLSNARCEVVAYTCANDMSSRSIEGANPLYLPQAKVYDAACALGPAAVLAWHLPLGGRRITLSIERAGEIIFAETGSLDSMVRDPAELCAVVHAAYTLPAGAWLMTGTGIVPPLPYSARAGDIVRIEIDGIGVLRNGVKRIEHSGARALPRI
jgi:2-dehydro-3-deoxy-D-arabinonate dehydratase